MIDVTILNKYEYLCLPKFLLQPFNFIMTNDFVIILTSILRRIFNQLMLLLNQPIHHHKLVHKFLNSSSSS